jgi:sugar phosphate permease
VPGFGFTAIGLAPRGQLVDATERDSPPTTKRDRDRGETRRGAGELSFIAAVAMVFLPFSTGYFMSYLFRSTNAIIAKPLIADIGLDAGDLGLLTSVYFLTFAAFQLPLGVLLDRYGPRRVQSVLLLVAAGGAVLFSHGESLGTLALGRGLIGLGVAGCLMASIKAFTLWFDERLWPAMNGCVLAVGGLGAMAATTPLELALCSFTWREIFLGLAAVTVASAVLIFLVVPERRASKPAGSIAAQARVILTIYADRFFWRLAPITITMSAAQLSIMSLWLGPWLGDVGGFDRETTATYLLIVASALAGGSILIGFTASWLDRVGVPLMVTCGVGSAVFIAMEILVVLELVPTSILPWVGFGLLANISILVFAMLTRHFPKDVAGRVTTALNLFSFLGAYAAQHMVGVIIDLWPPKPGGGFESEAYQAAFGTLLVTQLVAFAIFLLPIGKPGGRHHQA